MYPFTYNNRTLPSFASIEAHARACGIPLVSQLPDPEADLAQIAAGDFYCGWMSKVCWGLSSAADLPAPSVRHTFIPREIFAECLRRWTFEDIYSIETLEKIHLLAEQAMGGYMAIAAGKHPLRHLTFSGMVDVLTNAPKIEELLAACPVYDLKATASETELVDYRVDVKGGLAILTTPEIHFPIDVNALSRDLASLVGGEITRESLEIFWGVEFRGFECPLPGSGSSDLRSSPDGSLRCQVTPTEVIWRTPTLTITSPNNENFRRFVAQLALRA